MEEPTRHWSFSWRVRTPPGPAPGSLLPRDEGIEFRSVWNDPPSWVRADVKALWLRLNALPGGVDLDQRAAQVCIVGYKNDTLVAVCTAELTLLPRLGHRFAMIRTLVAPEHRTFHSMWALVRSAYGRLEGWSRRNPLQKIMGVGAIVQSPELDPLARRPAWPVRAGDSMNSGLILIGYTDRGEQIRVAWFDHARV